MPRSCCPWASVRTGCAPERAWRLVATASLAMADAAEEAGGLADGAIRLKWPNDLVVEGVDGGGVRKLAGLLGETDGLGTDDPRVVVGLGINADWAPADFPPELVGSMTRCAKRPVAARWTWASCSTPSSAGSRSGSRPCAAAASTSPTGRRAS